MKENRVFPTATLESLQKMLTDLNPESSEDRERFFSVASVYFGAQEISGTLQSPKNQMLVAEIMLKFKIDPSEMKNIGEDQLNS